MRQGAAFPLPPRSGGEGLGVGGAKPADKRVRRARTLRRNVTEAEKHLWQRLRALPLATSHFRRQATIGPYFADFACHTHRLVIELDGWQHGLELHSISDAKRDAYMASKGYRVLRFWNNEVMQNLDGVISAIADALSAPLPPTPDPSPPLRGGRGSRSTDSA